MKDIIENGYFGNGLSQPKDLVLNIENHDGGLIRFDVLTTSRGGDLTYASKTYCLGSENGFGGLFDLFDDFFHKRIGFFNSSRSVQRFLLSLNSAEKVFSEKTGRSFLDYYAEISNHAIEAANINDSFSNPMTDYLSSGYGIESESNNSYAAKMNIISGMKCGTSILDELNNFMSETHDFGKVGNYVCIDATDDCERTFFMEPSINMPMLFRYFDFAVLYMDNLVSPYAKSRIFGTANSPKVEIYNLGNDTTLNDLLSACGEYGDVLTGEVNGKDIFDAEVTRIEYTDEYIEGKMLSSIIAH